MSADRQDKNFDCRLEQFKKNIYQSFKGQWRLKLLKQDLLPLYKSETPLDIWDAGCGLGQISLWLAQRGHKLTLCDISENMLEEARKAFQEAGIQASFHHTDAQTFAQHALPFDMVLLHAVIEWLAKPEYSLDIISQQVKTGGHLSLLFYNRNALVFSNALKGEWRWDYLLNNRYLGKAGKLTPPHPQIPEPLVKQLEQNNFEIIQHTGIRIFHDYLYPDTLEQSDIDELMQLEQRYCREPTYRNLGRYIHILAKKH